MLQLAFEAAVFLFELWERTLARTGGRESGQPLFPLLEALVADAQLGGDLLHGLAALQPELHGGAFEVFVVSFVFARRQGFVVHDVVFASSHHHPTLVHQIEARPLLAGTATIGRRLAWV